MGRVCSKVARLSLSLLYCVLAATGSPRRQDFLALPCRPVLHIEPCNPRDSPRPWHAQAVPCQLIPERRALAEGAGIGIHIAVRQPAGRELDIGNRTRNALQRSLRCLGERGLALLTGRCRGTPARYPQPQQDRRYRAGSPGPHPFRARLHRVNRAEITDHLQGGDLSEIGCDLKPPGRRRMEFCRPAGAGQDGHVVGLCPRWLISMARPSGSSATTRQPQGICWCPVSTGAPIWASASAARSRDWT